MTLRHTGISMQPMIATPVETAVSMQGGAMRDLVPWRDLLKVFDPWNVPAHLMKYLAHALSVDLWDDGWHEQTKRRMLARAVLLSRAKGLRTGLDEFLDFVDVSVLRVTSPPEFFFAGRAATTEEREAWIAQLPQIRLLYPIVTGEDIGLFASADYATEDAVTPAVPAALAKRAVYVVDGEETDTTVEDFGQDIWRVYIRRTGGVDAFADDAFIGVDALTPSTAAMQTVTVQTARSLTLDPPPGFRLPAGPSVTPITAVPETVAVRHPAHSSLAAFGFPSIDFPTQDDARSWIYDRIGIVDPTQDLIPTDLAGGFASFDRLGMHPHTAEIQIEARHIEDAFTAGIDPIGEYLTPDTALARIEPVFRALEAWRRASDVILFDTQSADIFRAGMSLAAGTDYRAGGQLRI